MNIAEFLRLTALKNIYKRLLLLAVISKRSIISNLAFAQPILLKFLFQSEYIITTKSRGFTKNLRAKICAFKYLLSLRSENTGPVTNVKSS